MITTTTTLMKKISYSNSCEDMKTYITYPTKDQKYVCQTGQFKGFLVESVDFCKLKIDQDPQGQEDPAGQINYFLLFLSLFEISSMNLSSKSF